jgi:glycosyltransferase involved in cell wall biosynthesis
LDLFLGTIPKMHILITVNAAWNIWNFRMPIVEALVADGHRVTILAPADDSLKYIESIGCNFIPLDMNVKGLNPIDCLKLFQNFKKNFWRERPDIVLSFTIKNNIFGALAASASKTPFIPNVTGLGTAFLSTGVLQIVAEKLYRKAFASLPHVFFQNADDCNLFIARGLLQAEQAHLLPGSGIDLARFAVAAYPAQTDAPVFLMIGRLLRDKGVLEYVEAARLVRAKWPLARFQLLGAVDTANRSAIDMMTVQSWQNEGVIEYLGSTEDVRPYIASSHVVVLPSYREGAPRSLIEAAAMARPLIASDVPGCRSVLDDGTTGLMCSPRSIESLAAACSAFLALAPEAQSAMGLAGRAKMEAEFDQVRVIQAYRDAIAMASTGKSTVQTA